MVVVRSAILTCLISGLIIAVNTSTVCIQNCTEVDKTQLQINKNFANKSFKSNHLVNESLETVEVERHFTEQREILIKNWIFHKMMSYLEFLYLSKLLQVTYFCFVITISKFVKAERQKWVSRSRLVEKQSLIIMILLLLPLSQW